MPAIFFHRTSRPRRIFLTLILFFWINILSEASPLPISLKADFEPPSSKGLDLKGPLVCYGNLTAQQEQEGSPLSCDGETLCQGATSCNDTLVCSQDWIDVNGTLACNGELFCSGTLSCNKIPAHPACLPGLGVLPPSALSTIIVFLIIISGGLSGLKSAFMSVDPDDEREVSPPEILFYMILSSLIVVRELAERIYEARQHSEFTTLFLCAMTLATVMINHSLPLMAACLLKNHLWGFLLSSALVVIFGEILPLMVFPRFPLLILGNMMWAIYTVSCVLCVPACLLSYIYESTMTMGPGRPRTIYNNKEIGSLVDLHAARKEIGGELSIDTVRVLHGTLDMDRKVARDIMKPLSEVKMKSIDSRMTFHSWTEISDWGYSRIPIYRSLDNDEDNNLAYFDFNIKIIGFLHVFDFIFVIIDEITTLKGLPLHKIPVVGENYPLWDLLRLFQEGASHMAIVERDLEQIEISDSPVDPMPSKSFFQAAKEECQRIQRKLCPCYSKPPTIKKPPPLHVPKYWTDDNEYLSSRGHPTGIVTLEDVIEALIQSSILDEKDISLGRRRMRNTNSESSSRIITSSEQTPASNSRESLSMSHEMRLPAPPVSPELYDAHLSSGREVDYQRGKSNTQKKDPPLSPLSLSRAKGQSRRRVSFPKDYSGIHGTPYLGQDIENFDGRKFKSRTFPRNKDYGRINMEGPSTAQPVDLLGPMRDEEVGLEFVSEDGLDIHDIDTHGKKK